MADEESLVVLQQKKEQLDLFRQDYHDVASLLREFPKEPRRAMVPFGNVAFMEGSFEEPDEILVSLGLDYFAQYTSLEAAAVAERRMAMVDELLRSVEEEIEVKELTQKLQLFDTKEDGEPCWNEDETAVDIREEWTAEDEAVFASKGKAHTQTPTRPIQQTATRPVAVQPKKALTAVKETVTERKTSRPRDPMATALPKQARESLFRRQLRKDATSSDPVDETLAPNP